VDLKLIELARTLQGKIVTNDFNLNKVAQLRGVEVLNINELANALKPVVLPGEFMKVFILKEGKEYNQGVAYLDDGTMVVVDNARKLIGKTIDVVVTSVLQTTAGKMIFGRHIDQSASHASQPAPSRQGERRRRREAGAGHHIDVSVPPYHWWRTVFFLIPAISLYTIVLGTLSIGSSLFEKRGYFAHWCARTWSRLILRTTGVHVDVAGLERLVPGRPTLRREPPTSTFPTPSGRRRNPVMRRNRGTIPLPGMAPAAPGHAGRPQASGSSRDLLVGVGSVEGLR
jgi:hypothetical protein